MGGITNKTDSIFAPIWQTFVLIDSQVQKSASGIRTDHDKGKIEMNQVIRESLVYITFEYVVLLSDFVSCRFFLPTDVRVNLQIILNTH